MNALHRVRGDRPWVRHGSASIHTHHAVAKRLQPDHYLLCFIINLREQIVAQASPSDQRSLLNDRRLRWLLFIAHVILRRHGCDLRYDFNLEAPSKNGRDIRLDPLKSMTIDNVIEQCANHEWIECDTANLTTRLTESGRQVVLAQADAMALIPWTDEATSGRVGAPDQLVSMASAQVRDALTSGLSNLFLLSTRNLRQNLIEACNELAGGWQLCPNSFQQREVHPPSE